jgi:uncharacterized protein (TIGR02391 family)
VISQAIYLLDFSVNEGLNMSEKEGVRRSVSAPSNSKMGTRGILRKLLEGVNYEEEKSKAEAMFDEIITNPSIKKVSKRLFMSGDYRNAVLDAMIHLEEMVKTKARIPKDDQGKELSGRKLMYAVFDIRRPILRWSKLERQNEKDELEGYCHVFAGSVQGIRDPKAHMIFEQRPLRALQLLTLAALLADLVEVSEYVEQSK